MDRVRKFCLVLILSFLVSLKFILPAFAQQFPTSQSAGAALESEKEEKKREAVTKQLETPKKKAEIEKETAGPAKEVLPEEKFFVKKIKVTGSTMLSQKEIDALVKPYENKQTDLYKLRELTDKITALYRKKGYITSMSFLPPQKVEKDEVEIKILEGRTGKIEIRGNKWFKTSLIRNKITVKEGQFFDYDTFQRNIQFINEHPDRTAKAVLVAGEKPGTTDIMVDAKDKFPIHVGLRYDNFGSRYTGYSRYDVQLIDNNLTGNDDIFSAEWQLSDANRYMLAYVRYLYPFNNGSELGVSYNKVKVKLGREYEDLDMIGKGNVYELHYTYPLVRKNNFDLNCSAGFEYKNMDNKVLGIDTYPLGSKDRLRIFRIGADADMTDSMGRTILTGEMRFGVDDIMGGYADRNDNASRSGARTKFNKLNIYLARVHNMPWETNLLLRFSAQVSPYILCASEQFLIGGAETVRGFPRSERSGDEGQTASAEYSVPLYFIPKGLKVPFTKTSFYDALRVVMFYDWGHIRNRRVAAGENKNYYLAGAGGGLRFNLPNDFSVRFDVAAPVNIKPSNNSRTTIYIEARKMF